MPPFHTSHRGEKKKRWVGFLGDQVTYLREGAEKKKPKKKKKPQESTKGKKDKKQGSKATRSFKRQPS